MAEMIVDGKKASHNAKDLTGQRFGKLVAVSPERKGGQMWWHCECDCGGKKSVRAISLTKGDTKSCGCSWRTGKQSITHGRTRTPEYRIWGLMIDRCENANTPSYNDYGARGISVCQRWRESFTAFFEDMGPRPSKFHSIDRIDNDGHYEPGNCVWSTKSRQARNRRTSRFLEFNGQKKTVAEWCEITGLKTTTIRQRIDYYGWSVEKALMTPTGR